MNKYEKQLALFSEVLSDLTDIQNLKVDLAKAYEDVSNDETKTNLERLEAKLKHLEFKAASKSGLANLKEYENSIIRCEEEYKACQETVSKWGEKVMELKTKLFNLRNNKKFDKKPYNDLLYIVNAAQTEKEMYDVANRLNKSLEALSRNEY